MIADFRFDARLGRAALDDEIGIRLRQSLRYAGFAPGAAEQRPLSSVMPAAAKYSSR